jgi:ABC-2 type transport system ATP-binding protein
LKAIEVVGLTKDYGNFRAVDHISFEIDEGEIFGFLGPNGAGKTTTIKMLNTLTRITSGSARVEGLDVGKRAREVRKVIGVVPQEMTLDREMTGRDNVMIQGRLYGMRPDALVPRVKELLKLVDMEKAADRNVGTYSWGMQKRLELIMGFIHEPRVIFLDEPTLGLDAQTRSSIWKYVRRINRDFKVTIFLTTHYLEEADELCGRLAIINRGKISAMGTPTSLKNSVKRETVTVRLAKDSEQGAQAVLSAVPGVVQVSRSGDVCEVEADSSDTVAPKLIAALLSKRIDVESIHISKPDLNQVFLSHVSGDQDLTADEDAVKVATRERTLRQRR